MIAPIITDAMVEKAAKTRFERVYRTPWENENETTKRSFKAGARLDIESVAPDLTRQARAEGMEAAAKFADTMANSDTREIWRQACLGVAAGIRAEAARADALEKGEG